MQLAEIFRVLRRRWPIVLVGLVLVGVAAALVSSAAPASYKGTATVVLVPADGDRAHLAGGVNGLLGLDKDMAVAAHLTAEAVASDPDAAPALQAAHTTSSLSASGDVGSDVSISVTSRDRDRAQQATAELVQAVSANLTARQERLGIPRSDRIASRPAAGPVVVVSREARVRVLAVVVGVGMLGVLVAAFAVDGLLTRRQAKRASHASGPELGATRRVRAPVVRAVVTGLALVVLGAAALQWVRSEPIRRQGVATVVLVPPSLPVDPTLPSSERGTQNPLLSYTKSIATLARLTVDRWTDGPGRDSNVAVQDWQAGPSPVDTSAAPTPVLTVAAATEGSSASAVRSARRVEKELTSIVRSLQAETGAPPETFVTVTHAGTPQVASVQSGRSRILAALGLLVLGLALLCGRLAEIVTLAWRRRSRRGRRRWKMAGAT